MTPILAFFNNKGGVGKTTTVYHLAWMYADMGYRVLVADLDPQANLTGACLTPERLEELWPEDQPHVGTIWHCLEPLVRGAGDLNAPKLQMVGDRLALLAGDLALAGFEEVLSDQWTRALDGQVRAFEVLSAFSRVLKAGAHQFGADVVLVDLGPTLGAINRSAVIAADWVIIPLTLDPYCVQGLQSLGTVLSSWRHGWRKRLEERPRSSPDLQLPRGEFRPAGYLVLQHSERANRPAKAYQRWIERIPATYRRYVLEEPDGKQLLLPQMDPHCLSFLRHYRSLVPMAQEANKPMFHLKPADGAIGSHFAAVQTVEKDFRDLATRIATVTRLPHPSSPPVGQQD